MRISKHISYREATRSITATRKKIRHTPGRVQLQNMRTLAEEVFEPLREHFGVPIRVTSFYRSPKLNKAIGGSGNSQHCKGEAIDIETFDERKLTNREIFDFIRENLCFDQLIFEFGTGIEPDWVHVSFVTRRPNRCQVLRVRRINGRNKYTVWK